MPTVEYVSERTERAAETPKRAARILRGAGKVIRENWGGWLIMLPSIALFLFFLWIPLFSNISLSFYRTVGFTKEAFVWFENYATVFSDPLFTGALLNTLLYALWSVVIGFLLPILLALLLSEMSHFKGFFKVALYLPNVVPGIAASIMWSFLYDPDPGAALNAMFGAMGLGPFPFLNSVAATIPLIVLSMTWKGAGATMLIYLAAIQSVDSTYYEAARLDGANAWQRLWHVTLPHILPNIRMLFVLQIISVFQVFYEPLVMLKSGSNSAGVSLMLLSYNYAFQSGNAALSAASGVITALLIIAFTLLYLRVSRARED